MLRALIALALGSSACVQVSVDEPPRPRIAETPTTPATPPAEVPARVPVEPEASTRFVVREPVDVVPDEVTLIDAGAEPRVVLALAGRVGERHRLELELGLTAAMLLGTREVPPSQVPALRVVLDTEIVGHDADQIAIAITVAEVIVPSEVPASVRVQRAIDSTAEELRATKGRIVLAANGRIRTFELAGAQPAVRAGGFEPELGGLVAALQELLPVLPLEPIGDGARWQSVQHVRRDQVTLQQSTQWSAQRSADGSFELRASSDHVVVASTEHSDVVEAASGTTTSHIVWDVAHALPRSADAEVSTITRANLQLTGAAQRVSMNVELSLRLVEVTQ